VIKLNRKKISRIILTGLFLFHPELVWAHGGLYFCPSTDAGYNIPYASCNSSLASGHAGSIVYACVYCDASPTAVYTTGSQPPNYAAHWTANGGNGYGGCRGEGYPVGTVTVDYFACGNDAAQGPFGVTLTGKLNNCETGCGTDGTKCFSGTCTSGICTPCESVQVQSVSPTSGSGCSPTFTFTYSDSVQASNLSVVQFQIAPVLTGNPPVNLCVGLWDRATNTFNLRTDDGTGNVPGGAAPGSAGFIQNNQCIINFANVSKNESGNTLTLTVTVVFKAGFNGLKQVGMWASSVNGQTSGAWTNPGGASYTVNASPLYNTGCISGGCSGTYDCSGTCVANACNGVCCSGVCCPAGNSCCGPECCAPGYTCDGTHCAIIRSYECVE
jgi:hypothetical protein